MEAREKLAKIRPRDVGQASMQRCLSLIFKLAIEALDTSTLDFKTQPLDVGQAKGRCHAYRYMHQIIPVVH